MVHCFGHVFVSRRYPSEEPQYQYQEQQSSEHFEQQQEQYEEGKYNMNTTYHFKYIFILHFNTVCL